MRENKLGQNTRRVLQHSQKLKEKIGKGEMHVYTLKGRDMLRMYSKDGGVARQ